MLLIIAIIDNINIFKWLAILFFILYILLVIGTKNIQHFL